MKQVKVGNGADDVYVCHGVTKALQIIFAATLQEGDKVLALNCIIRHMAYPHVWGYYSEYGLNPMILGLLI